MRLFVDNFLAADTCADWAAQLRHAGFEDGAKTAGWLAKTAKDNQQLEAGGLYDTISESVQTAIFAHPTIRRVLRPAKIAPLRISRYAKGMFYGKHVDDAAISNVRTDVSFTIFLNHDYEGGALRLYDVAEIEDIRLSAGQAVFYPSGALHEVSEVTAGERLVIIGWIESHIADPRKREILADIETARDSLFTQGQATDEVLQLSKALTNLQRLWR